jgi:hypothetical protein
MATTPVEFSAPPGLTLDLELYPYGSDTIANGAGGDAATEHTNRDGIYSANVTETISGWHTAHVYDGSNNLIAVGNVYMEDDTAIKRVHDAADRILPVEDGAIPAVHTDASGGLPVIGGSNPVPANTIQVEGTDATNYFDTVVTAVAVAVWAAGTRTLTAATNITAAIATAVWAESVRTLTAATNITTDIATAVWASGTRTLTSVSGLGIATATKLTKYVQLLARKDAAIATDNAAEVTEINADGGSGAGAFLNTTDALEAIRDRGDAAWVTGGGGGGNVVVGPYSTLSPQRVKGTTLTVFLDEFGFFLQTTSYDGQTPPQPFNFATLDGDLRLVISDNAGTVLETIDEGADLVIVDADDGIWKFEVHAAITSVIVEKDDAHWWALSDYSGGVFDETIARGRLECKRRTLDE